VGGEEMMNMTIKSAISTFVLALLTVFATQVNAEEPPWTLIYSLDPGVACEAFGLDIYVGKCNEHRPDDKVFTDIYGNPVRIISGGKGCDLKFVNQFTEATFVTKADGSVSHTTIHSDGSQTVSNEGHNILTFFDTDLPPGVGPSTKQYVGRVVYTVDPYGTWTLEKVSGRTVDICSELSE
jgi:hypothetical protein